MFAIVGTPAWANGGQAWNTAPRQVDRPAPLRRRRCTALRRHEARRGRQSDPQGAPLDRVERAEQPGLPQAPVRQAAVPQHVGDPERPRLRPDLQRDREGDQVGPGGPKGRLRRHLPARQQQSELVAAVRGADHVPPRDEGRGRVRASTRTHTIRTTAVASETPSTPPPPPLGGRAATARHPGQLRCAREGADPALRVHPHLGDRVRVPDQSARPGLRRHLARAGGVHD